jgi:hypothetical protein
MSTTKLSPEFLRNIAAAARLEQERQYKARVTSLAERERKRAEAIVTEAAERGHMTAVIPLPANCTLAELDDALHLIFEAPFRIWTTTSNGCVVDWKS